MMSPSGNSIQSRACLRLSGAKWIKTDENGKKVFSPSTFFESEKTSYDIVLLSFIGAAAAAVIVCVIAVCISLYKKKKNAAAVSENASEDIMPKDISAEEGNNII